MQIARPVKQVSPRGSGTITDRSNMSLSVSEYQSIVDGNADKYLKIIKDQDHTIKKLMQANPPLMNSGLSSKVALNRNSSHHVGYSLPKDDDCQQESKIDL